MDTDRPLMRMVSRGNAYEAFTLRFPCFLSIDGLLNRCAPGSKSVMSLVDYCVDTLCRHLLQYEELPPGLPTDIVDRILASLIQVRRG